MRRPALALFLCGALLAPSVRGASFIHAQQAAAKGPLPPKGPLLFPERAAVSRRAAILKDVADWKLLLPEDENHPLRRTFLPQLDRLAAESIQPDADLDKLGKELVLWKNLLMSELQAADGFQDQAEFIDLAKERMNVLVTARRLETREGRDGTGKISAWKAKVQEVRDASSLRLLYENMKLRDGLVQPGSVPDFPSWVSEDLMLGIERPRLRPEQAGAPPVPVEEGMLAYLDWDRAKTLAIKAYENARDFVGLCYGYVQKSLDWVLPQGWRREVRRSSAYQFSASLESNPRLFDKLKLRRVPSSELSDGTPPIGAVVVFNRGACGFNSKHGHIEVVVSHDPPMACSDGCTSWNQRRISCVKKLTKTGQVNVYIPSKSHAPRTEDL